MIFTALDVSSLAVSLDRWEWAEYGSCALVAAGCIGEYIAEFTDCWTGGLKERKDRLAKRSTLLLISALALELICLVKTNRISGMLIGSLSEKAVAADTKAQSALDKAALAEHMVGEAVGKSDVAKDAAERAQEKVEAVAKRAEEVDNGLAMTQYLISARSIDNVDSLVKQLKGFKGQRVNIGSYAGDAEGYFLCEALYFAAHSAEMNAVDDCAKGYPSPPFATGVAISGPDIQETMDLARLLVHTANTGGASSAIKAPALTIFVGVKPPFVMGQARGVKAPTKKQTKKQSAKP